MATVNMAEPQTLDTVVVGGGVGGLSAALRIAGAGARVAVLERSAEVGGKMRVVRAGDREIDAGPTVLTMRGVFESLWAEAGLDFHAAVPTQRLEVLARHGWSDGSTLDLYAGMAPMARACHRTGRRYIGAEIDPERHRQAMDRLHMDISARGGA